MKTMLGASIRTALGAGWVAAACLSGTAAPDSEPERMPLLVSAGGEALPAVTAAFALPAGQDFILRAPTSSWARVERVDFSVAWPAGGSRCAQVLVFLKDWDYFWYQTLLPGYLTPGQRNQFRVDFSPTAGGWQGRQHHGAWNLSALIEPKTVGIRLFAKEEGVVTCRVDRAVAVLRRDQGAPAVRNVRFGAPRVPVFEKFEVTFDLPDRYPDPFDSAAIFVWAEFTPPEGRSVRVEGFYGRDYYRQVDPTGEELFPQGSPYWRVRYAPTRKGRHRFVLHARDRFGETSWGPEEFEAVEPRSHGFVRVSRADPRFFEFDDGTPFFPIGHNIRSPFDVRHDHQFPWAQRWPEGSSAYLRYFKAMAEHGENLTEIWSAAWSLGLEWLPKWRGYHGIGQFNMMNAWETDRVLEEAERRGIYINYVVHNHGKFGLQHDKEWLFNPFNVENGGYLQRPEEYFWDPRALRAFRKLMRYTVARWGYSPNLFAWELWSELNLAGTSGDDYKRPEVVDWHRLMGGAVKEIDPYDHMISSHVSGDYNVQNVDIISLPEMDLCPVDAYHTSPDPLFIVELMRRTAEFNNPFGKPVLITEFGGTSRAEGIRHMDDTLHAALWAATCTPVSGTPMFWWWQLIEEEGFYPKFAAVSRFMADEDRRDPDLQVNVWLPSDASGSGGGIRLAQGDAAPTDLAAQCFKSRRSALGWIYRAQGFSQTDPAGEPSEKGVHLVLQGLDGGRVRVEFWDTLSGTAVAKETVDVVNGAVRAAVPAFARDIAFKVKRAK